MVAELNGTTLTLIALVLSLLGTAFAVSRGITAQIEGLRKELGAEIQHKCDEEAKNRHKMANDMQLICGKLETSQQQLARDTVRREDHTSFEARVTAQFTKLESRVEHVAERLGILPVLEAQTKSNGITLDKIFTRLDSMKAPAL